MDCKKLVPGGSKSFEDTTLRSVTSCQQLGNVPNYHYAGAGNMIAGVSCLGSPDHFAGRTQNDIWVKRVAGPITFSNF